MKNALSSECEVMTLNTFTMEKGKAVLSRRSRRVFKDFDAQDLVLELGGLPLALEQAEAAVSPWQRDAAIRHSVSLQ